MNIAQVPAALRNIVNGFVMALTYSWKLTLVSLSAVVLVCIFSGYICF